jgi:hypothetical protein
MNDKITINNFELFKPVSLNPINPSSEHITKGIRTMMKENFVATPIAKIAP